MCVSLAGGRTRWQPCRGPPVAGTASTVQQLGLRRPELVLAQQSLRLHVAELLELGGQLGGGRRRRWWRWRVGLLLGLRRLILRGPLVDLTTRDAVRDGGSRSGD